MHGFKVNYLTIDPDGESSAITEYDRRYTYFLNRHHRGVQTRHRAHEWGIGLFAGIMAEARMLTVDWQSLRETTGKSDYEQADALATRLAIYDTSARGEGTIEAYINLWAQKAATVVNHEEVWPSIATSRRSNFEVSAS
jgi:hypothetical protein